MTYLGITSRFRRRMLPLVAFSLLVVAFAAPTAYHIQKRHELLDGARGDARRVAAALRGEIDAGPLLWRYQSVKLSERLAAEGLSQVPALVVHDAAGVAVPIEGTSAGGPRLLYGQAAVEIDGLRLATVWVGRDPAALWVGTLTLGGVFLLLSILLSTVLYVVPVRAVAGAEARVAALMTRLALTLKEEERRRIARDLHDGAGQAITAARLRLLALRRTAGDDEAVAAFAAIAEHLDEALEEIRRSTRALAPPALAELGLFGALSRHCDAFSRAAGLKVTCEAAPGLRQVPPSVETASYRIIQEALTNIARHAGATFALVRLSTSDDVLSVEVTDDGVGLGEIESRDGGKERGAEGEGRGLPGIRERAELLGGQVRLLPGDCRGTRMVVVFPLPPAEDAP